jgi:hypothetical protein
MKHHEGDYTMKQLWICLALITLAWPDSSTAATRTVICDGCGELEYAELALRAAGLNETVVVIDGNNARLRKFVVSSGFGDDGDRFDKTAVRINPSSEEWVVFGDAIEVYERWNNRLEACGPGGVGDWLVPDFGVELACENHDQCYQRGGDDNDRRACDQQLYLDMLYMGAPQQLAASYFIAVRAAGWMFFSYRGRNAMSNVDPLAGCDFLRICDYTSLVEMPG